MSVQPKILAFAGSLRRESLNKKLLRIAVAGAEAAGAEVTVIDLRDFPLPIFDADIEAEVGEPPAAKALKDLFRAADGLLMTCPEYNSSVTGVWKNTVDWVSRKVGVPAGVPDPFAGKIGAILSAAPGKIGGLRGLFHVRQILTTLKVIVLPEQVAVPEARTAFSEDGTTLTDDVRDAAVRRLTKNLADFTRRLKLTDAAGER